MFNADNASVNFQSLVNQGIGYIHQQAFKAITTHTFLANFQHNRNRERRYTIKRLMGDLMAKSAERVAQAVYVEQTGTRVRPGGLEQYMVRFMFAQNIVNHVGRKRDLTAGLFLTGETALNQACDNSAGPKGPLDRKSVV